MVGGGIVCGDLGVLALVLDFREVMLTSTPELAHCGGRGQTMWIRIFVCFRPF